MPCINATDSGAVDFRRILNVVCTTECMIHSMFSIFTAAGSSDDYRVLLPSPFIISNFAPTLVIQLIIQSDQVALEGLEFFNVTLDIVNRLGPAFDGSARNAFFLNNLQVFIEDRTGTCMCTEYVNSIETGRQYIQCTLYLTVCIFQPLQNL